MRLGIFFCGCCGDLPANYITNQRSAVPTCSLSRSAAGISQFSKPILLVSSPSQFSHFDPQDSSAEFSEENLLAIGFCGGIMGAKWENCDKTL
ncbi:MAG: hypothetical protein RL156_22, partial [Bacteroidota bacterium]